MTIMTSSYFQSKPPTVESLIEGLCEKGPTELLILCQILPGFQ